MDTKPEEGKIITAEPPTLPTIPEKKEDKKLTRQQVRVEIKKRQFILAYLKHKDATKAYQEVYKVKGKSAASLGSELLKTIDFGELLEQGGITDARLKEVLEDGLSATRPYGKNGIIHADYATRHSYLTTALKVKRRIDSESKNPTQMQGLQIIINK